MGPAAKIFLSRQCRRYLQKEPTALEATDIPALAECCFSGTQSTLGIEAAESIRKDLLKLQRSFYPRLP
jgi:hypothetical protein